MSHFRDRADHMLRHGYEFSKLIEQLTDCRVCDLYVAQALQTKAAPMKEPMQCVKEYASLRAIEHTRTLDTDSTLRIADFLGLYISDTKWLSSDVRDVTWWTQVSSECCFVSKSWVLDGWILDDASWNDLVEEFPEMLEDPGYAL